MLKTGDYEHTMSGDALRTLLRSVKSRSIKQTSNDDAVILRTDNVDSECASDTNFRYILWKPSSSFNSNFDILILVNLAVSVIILVSKL